MGTRVNTFKQFVDLNSSRSCAGVARTAQKVSGTPGNPGNSVEGNNIILFANNFVRNTQIDLYPNHKVYFAHNTLAYDKLSPDTRVFNLRELGASAMVFFINNHLFTSSHPSYQINIASLAYQDFNGASGIPKSLQLRSENNVYHATFTKFLTRDNSLATNTEPISTRESWKSITGNDLNSKFKGPIYHPKCFTDVFGANPDLRSPASFEPEACNVRASANPMFTDQIEDARLRIRFDYYGNLRSKNSASVGAVE